MINKQIIDLVDLALKDALITQKERQVIVEQAIKAGCSEPEINAFINQRLDLAIKNRGKELLKACPSCNAQIPAISDECPYCGHLYKSQNSQTTKVYSAAAKIIEEENEKAEAERINISTCPNCGHPYPLVSNICPACQHVLHNSDSLSTKNLVDKIKDAIETLENLPSCGVADVVKYRWLPIAVIIFVTSLTLPWARNVDMFQLFTFCIVGAGAIWGLSKIVGSNSKSPVVRNKEAYYSALGKFECHSREAECFYGDNQEVKGLLDRLHKQMESIKQQRSSSIRLTYIILAIPLVGILAYMISAPSPAKAVAENSKLYADEWGKLQSCVSLTYDNVPSEDTDHLTCSQSATLSISLATNSDNKMTIHTGSKPDQYSLILSNVHLRGTGKPYMTIDEGGLYQFRVILWDSNKDIVTQLVGSISDKQAAEIMNSCNSDYYIDFCSAPDNKLDSCYSILQKAKSYTFITAHKKQ